MPQMTKVPFSSSSNRTPLTIVQALVTIVLALVTTVNGLLGLLCFCLEFPQGSQCQHQSVQGCIGSLELLQCPQSDCTVKTGQASMREGQVLLGKELPGRQFPAEGLQPFRKGLSDSHS